MDTMGYNQSAKNLLTVSHSRNDRFQYKYAMSSCACDVRLGVGNRHSRVGYIPINQTTGKGHKPAVPWLAAFVLDAKTVIHNRQTMPPRSYPASAPCQLRT